MYKKEGIDKQEKKDESKNLSIENGSSEILMKTKYFYLREYAYKLPFYSLWLYYVIKGRKYPYFYNFKEYSLELRMKQGLMIVLGFWGNQYSFQFIQNN
jgi:hypothetical protein